MHPRICISIYIHTHVFIFILKFTGLTKFLETNSGYAGINVLCGVGILSTPYAAKEGGWVGLSILFIFALLSFYTGILLRSCLDSEPGLETYPDIGQAAFGNLGRIFISVCLIDNLSFLMFLKLILSME